MLCAPDTLFSTPSSPPPTSPRSPPVSDLSPVPTCRVCASSYTRASIDDLCPPCTLTSGFPAFTIGSTSDTPTSTSFPISSSSPSVPPSSSSSIGDVCTSPSRAAFPTAPGFNAHIPRDPLSVSTYPAVTGLPTALHGRPMVHSATLVTYIDGSTSTFDRNAPCLVAGEHADPRDTRSSSPSPGDHYLQASALLSTAPPAIRDTAITSHYLDLRHDHLLSRQRPPLPPTTTSSVHTSYGFSPSPPSTPPDTAPWGEVPGFTEITVMPWGEIHYDRPEVFPPTDAIARHSSSSTASGKTSGAKRAKPS